MWIMSRSGRHPGLGVQLDEPSVWNVFVLLSKWFFQTAAPGRFICLINTQLPGREVVCFSVFSCFSCSSSDGILQEETLCCTKGGRRFSTSKLSIRKRCPASSLNLTFVLMYFFMYCTSHPESCTNLADAPVRYTLDPACLRSGCFLTGI